MIVKISTPCRQRKPNRALRFGVGCISLVLCQKIQAAQNHCKAEQNGRIQRQDPLAGHKIPPPLFIRVSRTADEYAITPSWAVSVSDAEMLLYANCECDPQQFLTKKGGGPSKEDPSPSFCLFAQDAFKA